MIQKLKQDLKDAVINYYNDASLNVVIEEPKRGNADLAIPLFSLVRQLDKKMPGRLVEEIKSVVEKTTH